VAIDASQDTKPIEVPDGVDRVYCHVSYSGMSLGPIELPVFDGLVSPYVLEDTIAAEYAWQILGLFFDQNLYGSLERTSDGTNRWSRNGCVLATGIDRGDAAFHDTVGWAVFLQELWNRPSWSVDQFYEGGEKQKVDEPIHCGSNLTVEVSDDVRRVICDSPELELSVEIGGTSLGALKVSVGNDGLSEKALISTICLYGAMELCRLVVRQALIGQPPAGPSLRRRLAERAQGLRTKPDPTGLPPDNPILSIGRAALADVVTPDASCVCIPRHHGPLGTSVSRRAELPGSVLDEVVTSCAEGGLPLVRSNAPSSQMRIFYAPDLVQRTDVTSGKVAELREPADDFLFGRG